MIDRVAEQDSVLIEYTLLTDPDNAVINRYGVLNGGDPRGRPIPHPTVLIVDRDGIVRWRFTEVDYRVRAENPMILGALAVVQGG